MPASSSTNLHPIYWNFDHAMRLIPLPDLMIVGLDSDHTEEGLEYVRAGCRVLVPPTREGLTHSLEVTISKNDTIEVAMGSDDDNESGTSLNRILK